MEKGNENDVKGGIVVDQLKRYARKITDHTGDSASAQIEVWFHPPMGNGDTSSYTVKITAFDYANRKHIETWPDSEDLRNLETAIDAHLRKGES